MWFVHALGQSSQIVGERDHTKQAGNKLGCPGSKEERGEKYWWDLLDGIIQDEISPEPFPGTQFVTDIGLAGPTSAHKKVRTLGTAAR